MNILLIDDHALVREGVRYMLLRFDEEAAITEAENCSQAVEICQSQQNYDVVLLDYILPDTNDAECLVKLRATIPHVPIIIMSVLEEPLVIKKLIDAGAKGYLPKSSSSEIMNNVLKLVLSGGIYVPPQALKQNLEIKKEDTKEIANLTPRQKQVLVLLGLGHTNKEIARELFLSDATIRTHVSEIFRVLNVNNRTQAGHIAAKMGLV